MDETCEGVVMPLFIFYFAMWVLDVLEEWRRDRDEG